MLKLQAEARLKLLNVNNLEDLLKTLILNDLNNEFRIIIQRNIDNINLDLINNIVKLILQIKNYDALKVLYSFGLSEDIESNENYINKDFDDYNDTDIRNIFEQKDFFTFYNYINRYGNNEFNELYIQLAEQHLEPIFSLILMENPIYQKYYKNKVEKLKDMLNIVSKNKLIYSVTILKHLDEMPGFSYVTGYNYSLITEYIINYMDFIDEELSLFVYYNTKFCEGIKNINYSYLRDKIIKLTEPDWNYFEMTNEETHIDYQEYRVKQPSLYRMFITNKEPKCLINDEVITCPYESSDDCRKMAKLLVKLAIKFGRIDFIRVILMNNLEMIDDETFTITKDEINYIPLEFDVKPGKNLLENCDINIIKLILANQKCNKKIIFDSIASTKDDLFKNINMWNPKNILNINIDNFTKILRIHHNDYHLKIYAEVFEDIDINTEDLRYRFYELCNYDLFYELIGHKKYMFRELRNIDNINTYKYIYNFYRNIKYGDNINNPKPNDFNDYNILNEIIDFSYCVVDNIFIILMYYYSLNLSEFNLYTLFKNRNKYYDPLVLNEINYIKENIDREPAYKLTSLLNI